MARSDDAIVAVVGATGLQGGAVARRLLGEGWTVRALTRAPGSEAARSLAALGAEVVRADTSERASLRRAFDGVHGVYNVQNHHLSGLDGEVAQGKAVADVAAELGVRHVVYGAAGVGQAETGVGSWDVKLAIVAQMRERRVPLTVLRPMAFMELMTNAKFFPAASTWHLMPTLMGADRAVGWLAVDDLAAVAAAAFADPARFVGQDLSLVADVRTIAECRGLWREATGRPPRRLPMPAWLFQRFAGVDETTMWRWLRDHDVDFDTTATRAVHPEALTVREWLARRTGGAEHPRHLEGEAA